VEKVKGLDMHKKDTDLYPHHFGVRDYVCRKQK